MCSHHHNFRTFSLLQKEIYYHHLPSLPLRPRQPLNYSYLYYRILNLKTYLLNIFSNLHYLIISSCQHTHTLYTDGGTRIKRWPELPKLIQLIKNRAWFETHDFWFPIHCFFFTPLWELWNNLWRKTSELVLYGFKSEA